MSLLSNIKNKIKAYILRKAMSGKLVDILEVRTKDIRLTSVITETDIRIENKFFFPITILSIETDLLNRDGLKVGRMTYHHPVKIGRRQSSILTTVSEISIITSLFQAISSFLMQTISMQSVGIAKIRLLWWTLDVPVNDLFEIHSSKLKLVKDETEEERTARKEKEMQRREIMMAERIRREEERKIMKEEILKRRYKENYVPKELRKRKEPEFIITNEIIGEADAAGEDMQIVLDEQSIQKIIEEDEMKRESDENKTSE